ncbi:S8 family serine peptidase [Demequina iriomotensis]|uniref:S8 family serine peptidase n=1 Tax=Demequina iriomotensis TaxID=1536641 RepID=UPI0009E356BF|nr:S8 family serine peptidase [Demequina iriomotensis]
MAASTRRAIAVAAAAACAAPVLASCAPTPAGPTVIGLVDTGVIVDAPQFEAYAIDQESPTVSGEHGTLVLSVLLGVAGDDDALPPKDVDVVSVDVGADATADDLAAGIEAALDADVDVVSISMGCRRGSPALAAAVGRAEVLGTPIVAAAGNVRFLAPDYPARYASVIGVGAVAAGRRPWSESASDGVEVTALGVDVHALDAHGEPRTVSGTSFATALATHDLVLDLG